MIQNVRAIGRAMIRPLMTRVFIESIAARRAPASAADPGVSGSEVGGGLMRRGSWLRWASPVRERIIPDWPENRARTRRFLGVIRPVVEGQTGWPDPRAVR